MKPKITRLGHRMVPVANGKTVVVFDGGARGRDERGRYAFWVAVTGENGIIARARTHNAPGERFNRMERERYTSKGAPTRRAYASAWAVVSKATLIRPAKRTEVLRWLQSHLEDAVYCASPEYARPMEKWATNQMIRLAAVAQAARSRKRR